MYAAQVKGNGFIFGAYTHCAWPAANGIVGDPTGRSFLFSLVNKADKAVRFSLRDKNRAMQLSRSTVCFGSDQVEDGKTTGVPNFILMFKRAADQKNANAANDSKRDGTPYQPDDGRVRDETFLAGQQYFAAEEIEVFQL